jgi:hypothetical protein
MRFDPEAGLRCWPVHVDVAGRTWTIPARPAADWMAAVLTGWLDVVPGLTADAYPLDDLLDDGTVGYDDCVSAARDALEAAAGCRWWTAQRLIHAACDWATVGGELLLSGVNPGSAPLGAVLAAAYRAATRHADTTQRARLDLELDKPPAGVPVADWFDEAEAADAFMALAAAG